ncbi:zinc ribbon domain-containing protein [Burkholderia anthina]|uniref:zinc ribbon domain-containing protein n=1 Tax=Burkholderia anthina TaxID=179879 RepID=UPI0009BD5C5B|nr:zinc ribbon domain-containing protein [Burkholderia anthina]
MILVYRYRVKSLNGLLNKQSRAVNYVWNFCYDTQKHALKWSKKWPTGFDLNMLTTGSSKALGIHSGTINATCEQYAKSLSQHRRPYLRYRGSTTRPKGIAGLRIREWACSDCGVEHDRDTNAALNILRCRRASLGVGIFSL